MSILQKLLDNKIGIGLSIVHWVILSLAFGNFFAESVTEKSAIVELLFILILIFDLPAMLSAVLLWLPVLLLSENTTNISYGFFFTCFFTITFQWLFVGKAVYNTFSAKAAKPISLSLNDE